MGIATPLEGCAPCGGKTAGRRRLCFFGARHHSAAAWARRGTQQADGISGQSDAARILPSSL